MLVLPEAVLAAIRTHAEAAYPEECCGILIGKDAGTAREISRAVPAVNIAGDRKADRYAVEPRDIVAAERVAAESGCDIVGYYHSHPDHPARPSATDRDAAWDVYSYVIVSVRAGRSAEFASFRLLAWRMEDERVEVV